MATDFLSFIHVYKCIRERQGCKQIQPMHCFNFNIHHIIVCIV